MPLLLRVPVSGSGHAWVRIDLAYLDPDPYREYGSQSEIDKNEWINLTLSIPTMLLFLRNRTYYNLLPITFV
jgi:hypothetical protein